MSSLTPSHIIEYLFCPRFTYFEYVLNIPQFEEKNYKVMKGRELHDQKLERNKDYLRKKAGAVGKYTGVYLTNDNLRGEVDEILILKDGTLAPLDYKFAEYNDHVFYTTKVQLYCYGILIEENFKTEVNKGFVVYVRSQNRFIDMDIKTEGKEKIKRITEEIIRIIDTNEYPKATRDKLKCGGCTYKNICTK